MYTGSDAKSALANAITVNDEAKDYVVGWLKDQFGVELK
jgi:predicted 3-demethylubiquinone-9 3-methyltransferase (glyoxalase superfamily)